MLGRIKWYNPDTRFGFIVGEDNQDYAFRGKDLIMKQQPCESMAIEFTLLDNDEAGNIQRLAWFNRIFFPDLATSDMETETTSVNKNNSDEEIYHDKFTEEYCDDFWLYQNAPDSIKPPYYP